MPEYKPEKLRHSPELIERWLADRSRSVEQLALAVKEDRLDGPELDKLAHKLVRKI